MIHTRVIYIYEHKLTKTKVEKSWWELNKIILNIGEKKKKKKKKKQTSKRTKSNPRDKVQCQNLTWACRMSDFWQQLTLILADLFPPPSRNRSSVGPTQNLISNYVRIIIINFHLFLSCPTLVFSCVNHEVVVIFSVKKKFTKYFFTCYENIFTEGNYYFWDILYIPFVFICS